MSSTLPSTGTPIRRRRFIVFATLLIAFVFVFGSPWELPSSLKDAGISTLSRANIAHLVKSRPTPDVDEIFGLLHLVTMDAEYDHVLNQVADLDPTKPIDLSVFAAGDRKIDWDKEVKKLNEKYPIVVFSKSYCRFSQNAKQLLDTYNIRPAPIIVEVDWREDQHVIKALLTRLTNHTTFPNIVVRGKSIGGFDDLQALHADMTLGKVLEEAGAVVRSDGR